MITSSCGFGNSSELFKISFNLLATLDKHHGEQTTISVESCFLETPNWKETPKIC